MSEVLSHGLAFQVGLVLGAFFFGGLWWTVGRAVNSKAPAIWFLGSLIFRTSLTLAGFYAVWSSGGQRLLSCLFGFLIARQSVMWLTRLPKEAKEASHAP